MEQLVSESNPTSIKILYGTVTGKSKYFAEQFIQNCYQQGYSDCSVVSLKDYDPEDKLLSEVSFCYCLVLTLVSY